MTIRENAKKLQKVQRKLEEKYPPRTLPDSDALLDRFLHYLLFYANPQQTARRAYKSLKNDHVFSGWNEVRVATVHEIDTALGPEKLKHSAWLARIIKGLLEGIWQVLNEMALEKLAVEKVNKAKELLALIEAKAQDELNGEREERRGEPPVASVIPPWAGTYILASLGLESAVPWDPHTERVASRLRLFDPDVNLVRRKKQLRALVKTDAEAIHLHHLLVEHGKRVCVEEEPRCAKCNLTQDCDFFKKAGKSGRAKSETGRAKKDDKSGRASSASRARKARAKGS